MTIPRTPLTRVLPGGGNDDIFDRFDTTEAADEYGPLPKGTYEAVATRGYLERARTGTKCFVIEFRVIEGPYAGRRQWLRRYFTADAMAYTKRDLMKYGLDSRKKLEEPFPAGRYVSKLTVVVRKGDDGIERNDIRAVEVIRCQAAPADPFAPQDAAAAPGGTESGTPQTAETPAEGGTES